MKKYTIGQKESLSKRITTEDVELFSKLSLDNNPVHLDDYYASNTIFKKKIVHGFLSSSLISSVIANKLPGLGSIYLTQDLKFIKPVYHGDMITAVVSIIDIDYEKSIYTLETKCYVGSDVVVDGKAKIKLYDYK